MRFIIIVSFTTLVLTGCFSSKLVKTEVPINLEAAQKKFPGYSMANFTSGKSLYESNCKSCHELKNPLSYSEQEWAELVPDMSAKSNKNKGTSITQEEEDLIFKYVVSLGVSQKE